MNEGTKKTNEMLAGERRLKVFFYVIIRYVHPEESKIDTSIVQ